jgi:hypothetical protein
MKIPPRDHADAEEAAMRNIPPSPVTALVGPEESERIRERHLTQTLTMGERILLLELLWPWRPRGRGPQRLPLAYKEQRAAEAVRMYWELRKRPGTDGAHKNALADTAEQLECGLRAVERYITLAKRRRDRIATVTKRSATIIKKG